MWARDLPASEYDEPLLPELRLYQNCQMLGQMPRAGGVLDQYPETLEAFRVITSAIRKAKEK